MFIKSKFQKFISFVFILAILLSNVQAPNVSAQSKDGLERQVNTETGRVSFIGPENGRVLSAPKALGTFIRPQDPALALANRYALEFGIKNPARELSEIKTSRPEDGRVIVRYQQNYQGIPVIGGELIVNTNENGDLYSMNGEVSPNLSLQTQPKIDPAQATQTALEAVAKWYEKSPADFVASKPELWIYDESLLKPSTRPVELVWRMDVTAVNNNLPVRELVLVNAERGNISLHFNQVDNAWEETQKEKTTSVSNRTPTNLPITNSKSNGDSAGANSTSEYIPALAPPATWYVATTGNDSNSCTTAGSPCLTINGAIGKAADGDTIKIAVGTYTGSGTEVVLINKSVTLSGGWNAGFTTRSGVSTIDGQDVRRGLTVSGGVVTLVEYFTILNGIGNAPGGAWGGGGIRNEGGLTVNNSVISDNTEGLTTSAIHNANGAVFVLNNSLVAYNGGSQISLVVFNAGTFTINNSIIERNTGTITASTTIVMNSSGMMNINNTTIRNNSGLGIYNNGTLTLTNSIVSGNIGSFGPGGIGNGGGTLTVNNSTISGNEAADKGAGLSISGASTVTINNSTITGNISNNGNSGSSGGISVDNSGNTVTIKNSILARNTEYSAPDCFGPINSAGYNIIGNNSGCTFSATIGDLVGTDLSPINPRLNALQDNGGPTSTYALGIGSSAIDAGNPATPGSGGNACLATDQRGIARPVGAHCDIGAYEGSVTWMPANPLVNTYTANNGSLLPGMFLCSQTQPNCTNNANPHADAAHKYAIGTYNFYATKFTRDSMDNNGMVIKSTVQYCDPNFPCPYGNAEWLGTQMVYGSAYGFALADDVVAHEFTHGVTQYESNLFYYYQSGAINESFSDVFGEYYDQTNGLGNDDAGVKWLVGEDVSGLGALRSMSNPPAYSDPDKMSSPLYYQSDGDDGGVHSNSGINNKAVYLMVEGGTFNGKTVTVLGWDKVGAIYYEVNTNLLISGSDYSDLYYALQQACTNLIGQHGITSGDCGEVKDAIDAVEMNGQPTANFNTDAPLCDSGLLLGEVFFDDMESGTGNWVFGAITGTTRWQYDAPFAPFAHSGLHSLYAADYPAAITDTYVRTKNPIQIPPSAFLRFDHAFGFENTATDAYDGGILEYSTDNGATWQSAGSLFVNNGYNGTIKSDELNPLAGSSAFVKDSHGYISSRLNLQSLANQSVLFRWRMGLDSYVSDSGWWLDDVRIYTCMSPHTISGNAGVIGATLSYTDGVPKTVTADGSGNYTITVPNGWSGTVTPTRPCYTFNPVSRTYNNVTTDQIGQNYTANLIPGSVCVLSILRASGNPTNALSVDFTVTFSGPVTGVDAGDFALTTTGVTGASITTVTPVSAAVYTVTVNTGVGSGTIRLDVVDDDSIKDSANNPLGGVGAGNGNYTSGEVYTISKVTLVDVFLGSSKQKSYTLNNTSTTMDFYPSMLNGPLKVISTTGDKVFTTQVVTSGGSYNELAGYPINQFTTEYWFPYYDHGYPNIADNSMRTWILVGNPSATQTATVEIYIGGVLKTNPDTGLPYFSIAPGANVTPRWKGLIGGPVQVKSTNGVNIFASERVFTVPYDSFNEVMGYPANQFTTEYWFPWYDTRFMDTYLLVGNTSGSQTANVDIYIGPNKMGSYAVAPNATIKQRYDNTLNGPVRVVATNGVNIVTSEFTQSGTENSFNEVMGYPFNQFVTEYWFPYYDHGYVNGGGNMMRTWILVGNPSASQTANVEVRINGVLQKDETTGLPYFSIAPGANVTPRWKGLIGGPVQVKSTNGAAIFTSERVFTVPTDAFNEFMGIPASQFTTEYWFTWYDTIYMSTKVLIAKP